MSSTSSNKQPLMVDRPASTSTLLTVASGQAFSTSLIPTAVGNATRIFDVDSALTDTSVSGAYIDEIYLQYTKRPLEFIDAQAVTTATGYTVNAAPGTTVTITFPSAHNARVGQKVWANFTSHSSGTLPASQELTVTAVTPTTIVATLAVAAISISGNCTVQLPVDICFYAVGTSSITSTNQFFPLFVSSISAVASNSSYSLTLEGDLPFINHPVVQAGANFTSANSTTAPKTRGLMLRRGQALYAAVSGTTALTSGFYANVQGGFY